jgi:hypothetical protein
MLSFSTRTRSVKPVSSHMMSPSVCWPTLLSLVPPPSLGAGSSLPQSTQSTNSFECPPGILANSTHLPTLPRCSQSLALAAMARWALTTPTTPNPSYLRYGYCKNKEVLHLSCRAMSVPAPPSRRRRMPPLLPHLPPRWLLDGHLRPLNERPQLPPPLPKSHRRNLMRCALLFPPPHKTPSALWILTSRKS